MMKTITIKSLEIHNFKGVQNRSIEFFNKTEISGQNAVGKTTCYEAVLWLLFGINQQGNSAVDVRPHDKYGNPINNIDISVTATFDVDGKSITLTKVQKQKYVKDRSTGELSFKGNEDSYEINEIPKSKTEYKTYISDKFVDENTFIICSNASSLFKLDTKKRRTKLTELADVSDKDIIATSKEYEEVADMLEDGTLDELIKRSKGKIKKFNDELNKIPIQIQEVENTKADIDLAELELAKNSLNEELAEIDAKEQDLNKLDTTGDEILSLDFEINDIKRKANEDLFKRKEKLEVEIAKLRADIASWESTIDLNSNSRWKYEADVENYTAKKDELSKEWEKVNSEVFDENTTICPTCGRKLEETAIKDLVKHFEGKKQLRLQNIESEGFKLKRDIENAKDMIAELKACNEENSNLLSEKENQLAELKKQLAELPKEVDLSTNEEYLQLRQKQDALLETGNNTNVEEARYDLTNRRLDVLEELEKVNKQFALAEANDKADTRIEELRELQTEYAQKISTEERTLDLLDRFNKDKMKLIEAEVNKHFNVVKWRLFQKQVNGEYADVCQALVGGSNYETCLNTSYKILADIDIMQAFQNINNVSIPIWVDNAESINEVNMPDIQGQVITLRVSEDKELIVKER